MTYTVKEGDCLSSIAEAQGFFWETLWNLEENRALRELRENPNVLYAGDKVFIPEKRQKEESGATAQKHVFRLKGVPVRVVFRLLDLDGNPRGGLPYTLHVDGKKQEGTVPEDGIVSQVVPPTAKVAKLVVHDPDGDEEYVFNLGHLNPIDTPSGVKARLLNLGFYGGEITGDYDDAARDAIRRFQEFAGLPVTGEMDDATRAALVEKYGC